MQAAGRPGMLPSSHLRSGAAAASAPSTATPPATPATAAPSPGATPVSPDAAGGSTAAAGLCSSRPRSCWLDCDPGHDDALAIILAGHTPGVELLGVSTVAGNQTLDKVSRNALDVLDAAGLSHIDVVPGQAKPLLRPCTRTCPEVHGNSGLDGPQGGRLLPRSTRQPLPGKAAVVMYEAIRARYEQLGGEQRIDLVCTGALSNAAMLLLLYPEVIPMIEITIMGGCLGIGNTGPVMEFNIMVDPEAAKVVFESGVILTMVPLEVTHTVLTTPKILAAIGGVTTDTTPDVLPATTTPAAAAAAAAEAARGGGTDFGPLPTEVAAAAALADRQVATVASTPFRHAVVQLLLFFADTYRHVFQFEHPPLHDPAAVAYIIAPHLYRVEEMRVDVEVCSPLSAGQTVCDRWHASPLPKNCRVALELDVPTFWQYMVAAIGRADAVSPLNKV